VRLTYLSEVDIPSLALHEWPFKATEESLSFVVLYWSVPILYRPTASASPSLVIQIPAGLFHFDLNLLPIGSNHIERSSKVYVQNSNFHSSHNILKTGQLATTPTHFGAVQFGKALYDGAQLKFKLQAFTVSPCWMVRVEFVVSTIVLCVNPF